MDINLFLVEILMRHPYDKFLEFAVTEYSDVQCVNGFVM